jgi:hypothetical protein
MAAWSGLLALPLEVQVLIAQRLIPQDLAALALVCKDLCVCAMQSEVHAGSVTVMSTADANKIIHKYKWQHFNSIKVVCSETAVNTAQDLRNLLGVIGAARVARSITCITILVSLS